MSGNSISRGRDRIGLAAALLATYVIWGSTYLGIRSALEGFPPFLMAGARFTLAGGVLFAVLCLRGAPGPAPRLWGSSAFVGVRLGARIAGGEWGATPVILAGVAFVGLADGRTSGSGQERNRLNELLVGTESDSPGPPRSR